MNIKFESNRIVFDSRVRCGSKLLLLLICVGLLGSVVSDGSYDGIQLAIDAVIFGIILVEGIFGSLLCSSFVIDESGITENIAFVFHRHLKWSQIHEYFGDDINRYRSSGPTHHRFVFIYGKKFRKRHTPYYSLKLKSKDDEIFRFCDQYFKNRKLEF